jgi:hypothetical protein
MKKLITSLMLLAALCAIAGAAPTVLPTTTLSAAVTSSQNYVFLASVTNVTGPSQPVSNGDIGNPTGASWTVLWVGSEAIRVTQTPGTSSQPVYVERGWQGTPTEAHNSGDLVWVASPYQLYYNVGALPAGACTRASLSVVPQINIHTAVISDCLGGYWVNGVGTALPPSHIQSPVVGGIAVTSLTNGVAMPVSDMSCTEVFVPYNKLLTGIGLLNGATASTDNHLVVLYDATGNLLANSATAGVTASGASDYQYIAFTSKYFAVGPAQYYGCYQTNGTTGLVHMADSATGADTIWAGYIGTQTFGTIPATITVPTTFTTAQGVMLALY